MLQMKKWVNVYNENQYRIDAIFEALVSFYSYTVILMHLNTLKRDLRLHIVFELIRLKSFIFQSYIYTELNNLLDIKGKSSITNFIDFWSKDISNTGDEFKKIFGNEVDLVELKIMFQNFNSWIVEKEAIIREYKTFRDKNFSHIDHNFDGIYRTQLEDMIELIAYVSDFLSKLNTVIKMSRFIIIDEVPVAQSFFLENKLNINILRIRFKEEISTITRIYLETNKRNKTIFLQNCYDSVEVTLKRLKLIEL